MAKVTKETKIAELLDMCPDTAEVLMSMGMHCLGCPGARSENLERASMVHGVDLEDMLKKLNAKVEEKK